MLILTTVSAGAYIVRDLSVQIVFASHNSVLHDSLNLQFWGYQLSCQKRSYAHTVNYLCLYMAK